ncbi:MAG TPA: TolC family outer membrane protein [Azonexus sp.]|nr:TolC family outer membrane protein [Azonexus sp.]
MPAIRFFIAMALCWLAPGLGAAAENLLSLYREAQSTNAAFLAARAGAEVDWENENIALGQLLPSLSISGNYGRNNTERQIGTLPADQFNYDSYAYNLNLRQPLYRKYSFASYQQSKAQGEAATARLNQAANELAVRLSSAYMDALYADDQLRLIEAQKAAIRGQLNAAEKGLLAGSGTRIDIDEARARLDLVLAQELELHNLRRHNRRILGAFVNRELDVLAQLDVSHLILSPPVPADVNAWIAGAEANNAEYQSLLAQRKATEQEIEKTLAGHYPTLDLVASTGKGGNDSISNLNRLGDTKYDTTSYGVQLTIPLFAGGQVNASVRQARAKLEQVQQQGEEARRNIGVQTHREFDNVVQGLAQIRALERAEISGQKTVISAKKGVEAGVRSTLDVLQVEQQYFSVLRDLANARYGYLIAGLKLKALAGLLSGADIADLNSKLLPQ